MSDAPWWVETSITGVSILVGAGMIMWQQRAANRAEIKRKLFEELRRSLSAANDAASESGGYVFGIPTHVDMAREAQRAGQEAKPPMQRFETLLKFHSTATDKTVELMTVLKGHLIVSPHFELFHQALCCALGDANATYQKFIPAVARMIPFAADDDGKHPYPKYEDAQVAELRQRAMDYWESMNTLSVYIEDILGEAQGLLLADTFKGKVKPRQPADLKLWVLKTDDAPYLEKLRKFFFEQHPAAALHRELGVQSATAALSVEQKKGVKG
jgi:hypothetical protein